MVSKVTAKCYLLPIVLCLLFIGSTSRVAAILLSELYPLQLTHKEQRLLESLTCRDKFDIEADKIVASSSRSSHDDIYAEVLCRSHDNFKSNSIHHVVFCEKQDSLWKCQRSELAIRMNDESHALIYFENDITIDTAYSVVMKLAASKYYQGEEVKNPKQSTCNIRRHFNDDQVLIPDVYVASCGLQEVFISTWCPQQECPRIIGTRKMVP